MSGDRWRNPAEHLADCARERLALAAQGHNLRAGDCEALPARTVFPDLRLSCLVCHPAPEHAPDPWTAHGPDRYPPPF